MRIYNYENDPQELLEEAELLIVHTDDKDLKVKLKAILPILAGKRTPAEQAKYCQFTSQKLHSMRVRFDKVGCHGLYR